MGARPQAVAAVPTGAYGLSLTQFGGHSIVFTEEDPDGEEVEVLG